MKTYYLFFLNMIIFFLISGNARGYELSTHAHLTEQSYQRSVLFSDSRLLKDLSINNTTNAFGESYYDMSGSQIKMRSQYNFEKKKMPNHLGCMNNSLLAGDVTAATTHLTIPAGDKYRPVFTALLPYMTEIVDSYSLLRRVDMSPEIAEYAVNRQINCEDHIFIINFLPDENGIWRIDGM